MKPFHVLTSFVTLTLLVLSAPVQAAPPESFAPVVEPLMPAVVNISTTQKVHQQAQMLTPMFDFNGLPDTPQNRQFKQLFRQFAVPGAPAGQLPDKEVTSLGSGFVIDPSGYVVTNNHVVGEADEIRVIFADNTHYPATLIGRDPKTDLALLKIKADKPLPAVAFGDSDAMRVGDWVIAVGNPFGWAAPFRRALSAPVAATSTPDRSMISSRPMPPSTAAIPESSQACSSSTP